MRLCRPFSPLQHLRPALCAALVAAGIASPVGARAAGSAEQVSAVPVELVAQATMQLASPRDGRLLRLPATAGVRFQRGEVLVAVDCEAMARHAAAIDALAAARSAGAEPLARAEQALSEAREAAAGCRIRAPFDGTVLRVLVSPQDTVAGGQPLLEIAPDRGWRVRGSAATQQRLQVGSSMRVLVGSDPTAHTAVVTSLYEQAGRGQVEFQARLAPASQGFMPGQGATALLPAGQETAQR